MLLAFWAVALFALCFALDTRHRHFPYFYHPDEPGKVEQVLTGRFNFHHPMLLLATTRLVVDLCHVGREPQAVVEAGRCVSAGFMAGAVVAFSLLAYLWRGWRAALVSGAALAWHHQLFELAHYMKEDSALLFGVACALLCALAYTQHQSAWRAALLGAGCALAVSGKYLGIVVLFLAVPVLWSASRVGVMAEEGAPMKGTRRWSHVAAFAAALVLVFSIINSPLLFNFVTFEHSLHREVDLVVKGQGDVTRQVPHPLYWNVFIDNTTPAIWLGLLAFYTACWGRWARLSLNQKLLVWLPLAYTLALSFSPKENDRYFLPATALFTLFAAIGMEAAPLLFATWGKALGYPRARRLLEPSRRNWIYAPLVLLLLLGQMTGWAASKPGWSQYDAAFLRDDIAGLILWMKTELPVSAVVAADSRTGLQNPARKRSAGRGACRRSSFSPS